MFVVILSTNSKSQSANSDSFSTIKNRLESDTGVLEHYQREGADGPEIVGFYNNARSVIDLALETIRKGDLQIGIGIGPTGAEISDTDPLRKRAVDAATRAHTAAGKNGQVVPLCVNNAKVTRRKIVNPVSRQAEGVLQMAGSVVDERTEAEWKVVDLVEPGVRGQQRSIADKLGLTVQAVSQALKRTMYSTEIQLREAGETLLQLVADDLAERAQLG